MYKLSFLPAARQDMVEAVTYISHTLCNPGAAQRLAAEMMEAAETLTGFPYALPVYVPIRPLQREYRKLLVGNYLMFYWIEEAQKAVVVARVVYAKSNYDAKLE